MVMYHFYAIVQLLSFGLSFSAIILALIVYRRTQSKLVLAQEYALFGTAFFLLAQIVNVYMIVARLLIQSQPFQSFFVIGLLISAVILYYALPRLAYRLSGLPFPKPFRLGAYSASLLVLAYIFCWIILGTTFREGFFSGVVLILVDFFTLLLLCFLVVHLIRYRSRITELEALWLTKGYVRLFLIFLPFYGFELYLCATEFINIPYHFIFTSFMLFFWNLINLHSLLRRFINLTNSAAPSTSPVSFKRFGLTKREEEVAALLLSKYTYQEIADQLKISLPTVKTHTQNIYQKMNITRRTEMRERLMSNGV